MTVAILLTVFWRLSPYFVVLNLHFAVFTIQKIPERHIVVCIVKVTK